jgi:2-methylcitrate dehydratase
MLVTMSSAAGGARPAPDRVITDIAKYVDSYRVRSARALETAHYCLIDSLGCAFEAMAYPDCTKLLGPVVPGTIVPYGARVPASPYQLDPVTAAFNLGVLVRWLDYNDAFNGETVVHPSDSFGGILAAADWASRTRVAEGKAPILMAEVLDAAVRAYEVMGGLAIENPFTKRMGLDHVLLVKIAVAAVVAKLLGGSRDEIVNALSNAWIDGHVLATFRRQPNAGPRKSWAAGDAGARGVWLALLALKGEMGYPTALTARTWGFYDVLADGKPFTFQRPYGTYIVENVQFKISYPAAFHAQTAAEAAIRLHAEVKDRTGEIDKVELWTYGYAYGILNKTGPLANFADRDHCLQYVAAIGLIFGRLTAEDYEDHVAADPRIDPLRAKTVVYEDKRYSSGFLDPQLRSNANAIRVHFKDGSSTKRVEVEFATGHPRRRKDGIPLLVEKFEKNVARVFAEKQRRAVIGLCLDRERLLATPVNELFDLLAV